MRSRGLALALLALFLPMPARACGLALLLMIDVSGSVDPREYRVQVQGLAEALRDGIVSEALVREGAYVSLVQWTGSGRQDVTIPWTPAHTFDAVDALADRTANAERPWAMFATAVGEALELGERLMAEAPDCRRKVIDVSGDGQSNEGPEPGLVRDRLVAQGITVNALVITGSEPELIPYFEREVIGGHGAFALSTDGYEDYPERIREKLQRETARALSQIAPRARERYRPDRM